MHGLSYIGLFLHRTNHHHNMTPTPLFLGTPEIILILVVILLLFGAKRIPDLMKSLGKGVKSFKEGMKEVEDDIKSDDSASEKKDK